MSLESDVNDLIREWKERLNKMSDKTERERGNRVIVRGMIEELQNLTKQ